MTGPAHPATGAEAVPLAAPAAASEGAPADAATAMAASQPTRTAGELGGLLGELGNPTAGADKPSSAANVFTAGQRAGSDPGSGNDRAQQARRLRRRLSAIALVCTVLAAAAVVPWVLASSPGSPGSPGSRSSPGSPSHSRVATASLAATLTDPSEVGVYSVAFSPDGETLAASTGTGTDLWNVATQSLAATLPDPAAKARLRSRSARMARPWPLAMTAALYASGI